jgi:membrane protease YdiL (CAAX protease family)
MAKYLRAHLVLVFFGLTFLLSWSIWIPLALDHFSLLPIKLNEGFVMIVRLFGTLGPAVSAILVSLLAGGKPAVRSLLGLIGRWRVKWTWFAAAGLVFPALLLLAAWVYRLLPGADPLPIQPVSAAGLLVTFVVMTVSVLGEEIGWRGFALPRMQEKWTALRASLILGVLWTAWHLPFWTILDELARFGWGYWLLNWAFISACSIYITWLMNNTRNSLLMVLIFHWSFNVLSSGYLPITTIVPAYTILIAFTWVIALGLIGMFGPQRLARESAVAV